MRILVERQRAGATGDADADADAIVVGVDVDAAAAAAAADDDEAGDPPTEAPSGSGPHAGVPTMQVSLTRSSDLLPAGGSFVLTNGERKTDPLPYDASPNVVAAALRNKLGGASGLEVKRNKLKYGLRWSITASGLDLLGADGTALEGDSPQIAVEVKGTVLTPDRISALKRLVSSTCRRRRGFRHANPPRPPPPPS